VSVQDNKTPRFTLHTTLLLIKIVVETVSLLVSVEDEVDELGVLNLA